MQDIALSSLERAGQSRCSYAHFADLQTAEQRARVRGQGHHCRMAGPGPHLPVPWDEMSVCLMELRAPGGLRQALGAEPQEGPQLVPFAPLRGTGAQSHPPSPHPNLDVPSLTPLPGILQGRDVTQRLLSKASCKIPGCGHRG